jgi:DinB superfamily
MSRELIDRYVAGADVPAKAIAGLEKAELLAFPVPGTWSIQQIILHLMDSDLIASDRMKRVAAEDRPPTLIGYDETAFAKNLAYDEVSARDAAEVFRLNRLITAELLRRLPADAFSRIGHHNERGEVTLEGLLLTYVEHVDHHLKFIREKRTILGKPLKT